MKQYYGFSIFLLLILLSGCNTKTAGSFTLTMTVLEDADKGISDYHIVEFSKVFFVGNKMLEVVKDNDEQLYCLFDENYFSGYFNQFENISFTNKVSIKEKQRGALALLDNLEGYKERINMTDTILDNLKLKRFSMNTQNEFSVFYIGDNLNLPFSLSKQIKEDYKGTIRRIDTYQRLEDRFIILKLNATDTIQSKYYQFLKTM